MKTTQVKRGDYKLTKIEDFAKDEKTLIDVFFKVVDYDFVTIRIEGHYSTLGQEVKRKMIEIVEKSDCKVIASKSFFTNSKGLIETIEEAKKFSDLIQIYNDYKSFFQIQLFG